MLNEQFSRSQRLLGSDGIARLSEASVIIFGLGGVGSFTAEALARAGVGRITLCDGDTVSITNLNRQLVALHSTIGMKKTAVMAARIRDINPNAIVTELDMFYDEGTACTVDLRPFDYIADAIDSVGCKLLLVQNALAAETKIISCMGAGNKLNPMGFEIADISKTSVCPLAKAMRLQLRKLGIAHLPVVYSKEEPAAAQSADNPQSPASVSFVPSAAGLLLASAIIKDIASKAK